MTTQTTSNTIGTLEEFRSGLHQFIPKEFFAENMLENIPRFIKLVFLRKTIAKFINVSDPQEGIIIMNSFGKDVIVVPARKLKSCEKQKGLRTSRLFEVIDEKVRYNSFDNSEQLKNPNSITFGDSVTKSNDAVGLPAKAIYDWAYSIQLAGDQSITKNFQHNSLSENKTILKDADVGGKDGTKVASQAIHSVSYVNPGVYFPHCIHLDNVTEEIFFHLIHSVLNTHRYGAQTNVIGNNMLNSLIAVGFGNYEPPFNSYVVSEAWNTSETLQEVTDQNVREFIWRMLQEMYPDGGLITDTSALLNFIMNVSRNRSLMQQIYNASHQDCETYLLDQKIIKDTNNKSKNK